MGWPIFVLGAICSFQEGGNCFKLLFVGVI